MEDRNRTTVWQQEGSEREGRHAAARPAPPQEGRPVINVNEQNAPLPRAAAPTAAQLVVWRAQRIILYIFGIIEVIIAVRFVLRLLAANPASPFSAFVYNLSWVFVFPFNGVVPNLGTNGSVFETFSLIAIAIYILISFGLVKLLDLLVP